MFFFRKIPKSLLFSELHIGFLNRQILPEACVCCTHVHIVRKHTQRSFKGDYLITCFLYDFVEHTAFTRVHSHTSRIVYLKVREIFKFSLIEIKIDSIYKHLGFVVCTYIALLDFLMNLMDWTEIYSILIGIVALSFP